MVKIRPARLSELPNLTEQLLTAHRKGEADFYDLSRGIVYVAVEDDDEPFEMIGARMVWQIEPLLRLKKKNGRYAKKNTLRRGSVGLFRAVETFIATSPVTVKTCIAFVKKRATWVWLEKLGMQYIFPRGRFYGKEL